jgi:hypothetical protein
MSDMEGGSWEMEVRRWKLGVRSWEMEVRRWKLGVRSWEMVLSAIF